MAELKREELVYDDSVKLNSKGQVILGKLKGPCADFINSTRNGRLYNESLWEKVFNDPIVLEYFDAGGIPGELDHPADRLETCSEKIAIMMPEPPQKDKNGRLVATFDILDTPNGRIASTLAKYGYKLGISSRGNGDTYSDENGNEKVDESTYDFQGFDLVLLPAVKAARLELVESLGDKSNGFKRAINEALSKSDPEEKKIMVETLNNLDIEYTSERVIDKKSEIAANDDGATMVKDLQESLLAQRKLETQITELQEKLSVCYTKEAGYEDSITKYKDAIRKLSESANNANALKVKVSTLNEEIEKKNLIIKEKDDKLSLIVEKHRIGVNRQSSLNESISTKVNDLKKANSTIKRLNEKIENISQESKNSEKALRENLAEVEKNYSIKSTEYNNKLANANKLVEQYRGTAKKAVNKYIESLALKLGISSVEITNKLPSNYSFNDIDAICEELSQFKLKVRNLPFNLQQDVKKVSITEGKTIVPKNSNYDDSIDDELLRLANL